MRMYLSTVSTVHIVKLYLHVYSLYIQFDFKNEILGKIH